MDWWIALGTRPSPPRRGRSVGSPFKRSLFSEVVSTAASAAPRGKHLVKSAFALSPIQSFRPGRGRSIDSLQAYSPFGEFVSTAASAASRGYMVALLGGAGYSWTYEGRSEWLGNWAEGGRQA